MIQGKLITLRPARLEERKIIYQMGLSTEYMRQCFLETFTSGLESFESEYVEQYFDGKELQVRAGIMICLDDRPIGFISYSQVSDFRGREWVYHWGTMELDIWMDGEANCGKGYGVDAILALSSALYESYNIRLFMICPERINPRAIHAYAKAGFQEVAPDVKGKILSKIFGQRGLRLLHPDDGYLSGTSCFMIKKCEPTQ